MNPRRSYTTKELAEKAKVTPAYIRQCLLDGTLRGYKRGRDWFIAVQDGDRWLKDRQTQ